MKKPISIALLVGVVFTASALFIPGSAQAQFKKGHGKLPPPRGLLEEENLRRENMTEEQQAQFDRELAEREEAAERQNAIREQAAEVQRIEEQRRQADRQNQRLPEPPPQIEAQQLEAYENLEQPEQRENFVEQLAEPYARTLVEEVRENPQELADVEASRVAMQEQSAAQKKRQFAYFPTEVDITAERRNLESQGLPSEIDNAVNSLVAKEKRESLGDTVLIEAHARFEELNKDLNSSRENAGK